MILIVAAICAASFALGLVFPKQTNLTSFLLFEQDQWLLLCAAMVALLGCLRPAIWFRRLRCDGAVAGLLAVCVAAFCYLGHHWILAGHDLTRDEQMAGFDSRIYASGLLAQPLPVGWQAHVDALNTLFMLPVSRPIAWVSAYLPVNAAIRACVGLVADPALTGALWTGLGLFFLWKIARLLWPDDTEAAAVCVLLYLCSGQILFAGMTAYAMPAHLALNLLWLWLFLCQRWKTDLLALLVAFLATGLHQPIFHPMFAAPFFLLLLRDRNWRRFGLFLFGYAVICGFWLVWPAHIQALITGPGSRVETQGADYLARLIETLAHPTPGRWTDMTGNLLRFAAWQPALLVPMLGAGILSARRQPLFIVLALCVALPVAVMFVILPSQGHGFGYRYLHGAMGPVILLAAEGYRHIAAREPRLRAAFVRTALLGLVVLLPNQVALAHALYRPFADVSARIQASRSDYVVIGKGDALFANDLVINRPDLSNRPVRLLADHVDTAWLRSLCRTGATIALPTDRLFDGIQGYFEEPLRGYADRRIRQLSPDLSAAGCHVVRIDRD